MAFLFPEGQTAETLVENLAKNQWWGEIVGPHGSGKSSLVAALIPAIEHAGRSCTLLELHDGQRRLPVKLDENLERSASTLLIVDGYEQLSHWSRFLLKRHCRRHRLGLLVTSHISAGLPTLFHTVVTPTLAATVVEKLLDGRPSPISQAELAESLARHHGNLRETLFELYDVFEE